MTIDPLSLRCPVCWALPGRRCHEIRRLVDRTIMVTLSRPHRGRRSGAAYLAQQAEAPPRKKLQRLRYEQFPEEPKGLFD